MPTEFIVSSQSLVKNEKNPIYHKFSSAIRE